MAQEIERKFLVNGDFRPDVSSSTNIVQGYLSSVPERTVRVRIRGDRAYLTIKGIGNISGASRFEWEKEIPAADARRLMALCEPGVIEKTRHLAPVANHIFEIDEFRGDNAGLVIAEIELRDEGEPFESPTWLGAEVTGDTRYYNASLTKRPFASW